MKYRYRCTHKPCSKRVTLNKKKEEYFYKKYTLCPVCGSNLYLDNYRMNSKNKNKDRGVNCLLDCLPYPHRTNNKNCKQYENYILERSFSNSKKSHIPERSEEQIFGPSTN